MQRDREKKLREYERAGVGEYWLLDPCPGKRRRPTLTVYRRGADGRYDPAAPLREGVVRSAVVPGFWLRVEWLWRGTRSRVPMPEALEVLAEVLRYPEGPEGPEQPEALTALPYAALLRAAVMSELAGRALEARFGPLEAGLRAALGGAGEAELTALITLPAGATLADARATLGLR